MCIGIVLKGINSLYFGDTLDFIFEFIPQIIFMLSLFGFMIFMIFLKWSIDWTGKLDEAPSLITQMMNIILKVGSVEGKPLWGDGSIQLEINRIVLIVACLCIPFLLIPKPILTYLNKRKKYQRNQILAKEVQYDVIIDDVNIS